MNVLLIWEDHPEEIRFYLLKDVTSEQWDILNLSSGKFLGQEIPLENERALEKLLIMTTDKNDDRCIWINNEINLPYTSTCTIDIIIHCGILM